MYDLPQTYVDAKEETEVVDFEGKLTLNGWTNSVEKYKITPSNINPSTSKFKFLNRFRYKKWEAYVCSSKDHIFSFAMFNLAYAGGFFLHYSSKANPEILVVESISTLNLPNIDDNCRVNCVSGNYSTSSGLNTFQGEKNYKGNQKVAFDLTTPKFSFKLQGTLNGDKADGSKGDSIVSFAPFVEDKTLFFFTQKRYNFLIRGKLAVNGTNINLDEFVCTYDRGRGVWPMKSGWVWMSANGRTQNKERFGINTGASYTFHPITKFTADSFFVDGKIFKLPTMKIEKIKEINYENLDFQNIEQYAWRVVTPNHKKDEKTNSCELTFKPRMIKAVRKNFVFARAAFNIYHGEYSGICKSEEGRNYEVQGIPGILEDKFSVW